MEETLVRRILAALNTHYIRVEPPSKGYRNSSYPVALPNGEWLNVILYKREPGILERIKRADSLSALLAQAGLPTRIAHSDIISLAGRDSTRYARVYNYLPGHTISWDAYTMKHLKQVGKTLSGMHQATKTETGAIFREANVIGESLLLLDGMSQYFSDANVSRAHSQKLGVSINQQTFDRFRRLFSSPKLRDLPKQPLHMDFVRGNILFDGHTISGIIDFEKSAYGPPVFDIARTLAFLLVDCKYKPSDKIWRYFLQSGYLKHGNRQLNRAELAPLKALTAFYLVHDYYKFLRHNPFESLPDNEHFVRTRDFLVKDGIINYIERKESARLRLVTN